MHLLDAESNQPSMVVDIPAEDARLSPVKVTAEDPFMADPFMALQNDLDDVSEVIKHNLVTDVHSLSGGTSPSPSAAKQEVEMCSPATRDGSLPRELFASEDPGRERHIDQLVHLLQQPDDAATVGRQRQMAAFAEHFQMSPLAAATQSPESLLHYGSHQQQHDDPLIGGTAGMVVSPDNADSNQHLHFLHRADYGFREQQADFGCDLMSGGSSEDGRTAAAAHFPFPPLDDSHWHQQQQHNFNGVGIPMAMDQSPPPEPGFGAGPGVKQEMLLCAASAQQQGMGMAGPPQSGGTEAAVAAKNELIRMLLEMSPEELEQMRASRARHGQPQQQQMLYPHHSQPIFIQTVGLHPQQMMFTQQQQLSPPLDPPPPLPHQMQTDFVHQHSFGASHMTAAVASGHFIGDYSMHPHQQHFYPSPSDSAALTSPLSNGGFPSLAPSSQEFLEEESAVEEVWTDGEAMANGNSSAEANGAQQQQGPGRRKAHKTERRTAHNLIEKKYRCSINDRINQLKEMLAAEESTKVRLSKSATLRRAVDHILALRAKNAELMGENGRLRQAMEMAGIAQPTMSRLKQEHGTVQQQPMGCGQQIGKHSRGRAQSTRKLGTVGPAPNLAGPKDQGRVTLCVFMFLLLAFNPLALFLASSSSSAPQEEAAVFSQHRTLTTAADDRYVAQFEQVAPAGTATADTQTSWVSPWLRHTFVWFLNCLFVFLILNRLLVSGEPVADRRSPRWSAFLQSRRKAGQAVAAGNWKEAQRQLDESLQLLDRPLPWSGGLDEWMSLTWQIIRHLLNGLWIGRWFARRRRPCVQSQKSVCRSHAATAMVYHQLHQLHLLGVDGIGLTQSGALNLALLAANLAESAGSSAISHALRAEIYACAAIRCRLCMPRWLRRIISGYFFRRAKRHVSKSQRLEGTDMNSLQWLFHPLARRFLAQPGRIGAILDGTGRQRIPNFPFSDTAQSPKPVEVLRDAFKMDLLERLLIHLDSAEGSLRVADFMEQSQLLLQICAPDSGWNGAFNNNSSAANSDTSSDSPNGGKDDFDGQALHDLLSPGGSQGDKFSNWWAHLLTGALHWRHGDLARARQHYAVVHKCPPELGQNDLALAVGLAFCSRKICLEDRRKVAWAELLLLHTQRAFAHLRRAERQCQWCAELGQNSQGNGIGQMQRRFRLLACHWLLSSLLDLCSFTCGPGQEAPLEVRRLYFGILGRMERECGANRDDQMGDTKKLTMFRHLGETLCGGNGQDNDGLVESRLQLGSPSPTPSSAGSSTASTQGVVLAGQQRRKNTMEVLREGANE